MCGRFVLAATEDEIRSHFRLTKGFIMTPRYNIAPGQMLLGIRNPGIQVDFFRWGFIPAWAKPHQNMTSHINARSETIEQKPTFKRAFAKQRCIIPATGYYEWKTYKEIKQPFFIKMQDRSLFGFAGIWDASLDASLERIENCAILTTGAASKISDIHDRMPVILYKEEYDDWLNAATSEARIQEILNKKNLPLDVYPVSTKVNNPRFDASICIKSL